MRGQIFLIDEEPVLIEVLKEYIVAENVRLEGLQKYACNFYV